MQLTVNYPELKIDSEERTTSEGGSCSLSDHSLSLASFGYSVPSRDLKMYLTPATLYAFRLSFQQGAVSSVFRRNSIERHTTKSACLLAIIGLSMSIFSVKKMLASKHNSRL
ncbi:uncharacterized protein [Bombus fervidus]|uniref:uncharacterized protein n=1 Tax=Bombus fervidus TaxID=203811 RepID=UPI003D18F21F